MPSGAASSNWEDLVESAKGARSVSGLIVADNVASPTIRVEIGPGSTKIWIADGGDLLLVGLREQIIQQLRRSERRRSSMTILAGLALGSLLSIIVLTLNISLGSWSTERSASSLLKPYVDGHVLVRLAPVIGLGALILCWFGAWKVGLWAQRFRRDRVILSWQSEAAERRKDRLAAAGIGVLTNMAVTLVFLLLR
jgi:hypothetical protein